MNAQHLPAQDAVPSELRDHPQWVAWRYVERDSKTTKAPISPKTKRPADVTDPADWGTFEEAWAYTHGRGLDGIGFVFTPDDPFCGVDFDKCIKPEDGTLSVRAWERICALDSYAELSPSGRGVKVFLKARLPTDGRRQGGLEMYHSGRFFTVTGQHLEGTPTTIERRDAEVMALYAEVFGPQAEPSPDGKATPTQGEGNSVPDDELIRLALGAKNGEKFSHLWDGDPSDYTSPSEADLALCDLLAFWTNGDSGRMDRLFRQSGLCRPKWDSKRGTSTYGEDTIDKALADFTEGYTGPAQTVHVGGGKTDQDEADDTAPWPDPLGEDAYHGLAGEIVRAIEPHTEADPAALLVQLLVAFGNAVGRGPFFQVEATEHRVNLFTVLVGATSKGRKGTAWDYVLKVLDLATRPKADGHLVIGGGWAERVQEGLSSGEGLIWAIRDPIITREPVKEKGRIVGYQEVESDPGVSDKRLLVVETEFASVLRVTGRETSTLSATMRRAWDRGDLRILNKNSPARATGAHVSIIGHVTRDELLRRFEDTEAANGFGNRFLWVAVRRSKCLPEGGDIASVDFELLEREFGEAVEFARSAGEMRRDEEARAVWRKVYPELSEGKPGLFGAVTSRAEAQVLRLSCVYALLDCSAIVRREHLSAALAVWRYCETSAQWVFGCRLGDPTADEVLRALRASSEGLTRTEIRDLFGRHKSAGEISRALALLASLGNARKVILPAGETGGRPAEVWRAT